MQPNCWKTEGDSIAFTSYDPRKTIRETIGTARWNHDDKRTEYNMVVTDDRNEPHYIPMLLSEECRSGSMPEFPYIKMHRALTRYEPHNIQGSVRFMKAYIDLMLYFTNIDNLTINTYKQQILDAIQNAVRSNQSTTAGTFWMNVQDEREIEETDGQQVVYIYALTLYCEHHDSC